MHTYRKLYPVLGAFVALGLSSAFADDPLSAVGPRANADFDASYAVVVAPAESGAAFDVAAYPDLAVIDDAALIDPLADPAAAPAGPQPTSANATAAAPVRIDPMMLVRSPTTPTQVREVTIGRPQLPAGIPPAPNVQRGQPTPQPEAR